MQPGDKLARQVFKTRKNTINGVWWEFYSRNITGRIRSRVEAAEGVIGKNGKNGGVGE